MTSFSVYPFALDGYSTLPLVRNTIDEIRAEVPNRLRDAIIKIEQELGVEPSGVFATVRARLDSVGDASSLIDAHLINPIDAHDASAISLLDGGDNYVSIEVEGALGELASVLPASLDVIGFDNPDIANDGIPSFVGGSGTLHVFNTSGGANIVKKTQPVTVTGINIFEVGENNGAGVGILTLTDHSPATVAWTAPGDSVGTGINISALSTGDSVTLSSADTTKKIRIARTSVSLPSGSPLSDTFDILRFDAKSGAFSIDTVGFQSSNNITRTAIDSTGTSRIQFMIGGIIFPADRGTLVLQRKIRLGTDVFTAIATLDLTPIGSAIPSALFDESLRETGQLVYTPALTSFDTITLFDRLPARKDYETLDKDADGNSVYDNFVLSATFVPFQVAKYLIPISNSNIIDATLEATTDITKSEIDDKISAYRLIHYKTGITDFNGEPDSDDIFSISDALGGGNNGDNNVRMSNVFVDTNITRPTIDAMTFRPTADVESTVKLISGIHYYNSSDDEFDVELRTDTNVFNNAYLRDDILRFTTEVFDFPSGTAAGDFGLNVDVDELFDDGYALYSSSNLPDFSTSGKDRAFYLINSTFNTSRRIFVDSYQFSTAAHISATVHDPFGSSDIFDAYGDTGSPGGIKIIVNSFSPTRSTNTKEWFTDENKRVGTAETFTFDLDIDQFTFEDGAGSGGTLTDWDETVPLSVGDLQAGGHFDAYEVSLPGLIYPQSDYDPTTADIRPTQQSSTDYSTFGGDATYQRLFNLGITTTGGKLRIKSSGDNLFSFNDIDVSNSNRPVKIEVKIPGTNGTGFMDLGTLFQTGQASDGDGALSGAISGSAGDFTVPFTFGTKNTADTSNFIAVRITYFGAAQLGKVLQKIISFVELLSP